MAELRVLLDTNVILDVLLARQPWFGDADALWQECIRGTVLGYVAASTLTDIFYITRKHADLQRAHAAVRDCVAGFELCPVDRRTIELAISLPGNDFEDNVQIACATIASLDAIVTRDGGFQQSQVLVLTPAEALARSSNP
jgi:predicted nucleic acid-binding protein